MYDLSGQVALVTGAGGKRGLGRAIALRLAEEGADVVVNDIDADNTACVAREIDALGRKAVVAIGDVANASHVQAMADTAVASLGRVDILVNNAGARAGADRVPVIELDEAEWDRVHQTNVKGTFLCSQAIARHMLARGHGGRIVNISSTAGKQGSPRFAAYCASKFAVNGFTQSLAHELGPHAITVNAVCPSLIATERIDSMADAMKPAGRTLDEQRNAMVSRASALSPLGRMAQVSDVAAMVAFLASTEAQYLTGLTISVAGGSQMT